MTTNPVFAFCPAATIWRTMNHLQVTRGFHGSSRRSLEHASHRAATQYTVAIEIKIHLRYFGFFFNYHV
jgi:hypothetical protein